jgi:hypothetical protein
MLSANKIMPAQDPYVGRPAVIALCIRAPLVRLLVIVLCLRASRFQQKHGATRGLKKADSEKLSLREAESFLSQSDCFTKKS